MQGGHSCLNFVVSPNFEHASGSFMSQFCSFSEFRTCKWVIHVSILSFCRISNMQVGHSCLNFVVLPNFEHASGSFMSQFYCFAEFRTCKWVIHVSILSFCRISNMQV